MQSSNNGLGRYGEEVAARWLTEGGLRILERNWRCAEGELDIIALDGDTIAVCEVKTRSERGFQQPSEGIDQTKAVRLRQLAERWLGERWPEHFARLADSIQSSAGLPVPMPPEQAAEAGPKKARSGKGSRGGKQAAEPVPPVLPAPLPPGGVRIDLVAVVNRLKGAALVEHLRGAV
ncbi:YraN family protein [Kitasatospora sp. NBC_00070]|uniref:YraN family protein n=1 Tax=Kitasatospora sp. NBC_00070 TaxID=2975962 RepID=UPI0032466126